MEKELILDCGHKESAHSEYTRGYGTDKDGKKHCYKCCLEMDKKEMRKTGKCFAYHSKENGKDVISSWPGLTISDKVEILNYSTDNFGGKRTYLRFVFDNEIWSGFSMGVGMYMRAKRTKIKELYA